MGHDFPIKLSQLQIFILVTDCGSFSEAGLKLDMSQSAISYAIANLEADKKGWYYFHGDAMVRILPP